MSTKPVDAEKVRVTFDDVAGIDEAKAEVLEIVDFLKNPEKASARAAGSPTSVTSPMPVIVTGWRTPGKLQAATGTPLRMASI